MTKKYITSAGKPQWDYELNQSVIKLYVVLTRDGELKRGKYGVVAYIQQKRAVAAAKNDGDSVVEVNIGLKTPPIFIRKQVL